MPNFKEKTNQLNWILSDRQNKNWKGFFYKVKTTYKLIKTNHRIKQKNKLTSRFQISYFLKRKAYYFLF